MAKQLRIFFGLHLAHSAVFRAVDKALKKREGILTAHQVVLLVLNVENGLPSSEIAARAGMSKSRLTGLADALEDKGYIERKRGEQDARQQLMYITSAGRAFIKRTRSWVNALNTHILKEFDSAEQQTIDRFLKSVAAYELPTE